MGRNSSLVCVGLTVLLDARRGFDPPLSRIFPVDGIFPLELTGF